jgi:hypothetical protein
VANINEDVLEEMRLQQSTQAAQHGWLWVERMGQRGGIVSPGTTMVGVTRAEQQRTRAGVTDSARVGKVIVIRAREIQPAKRPLAVCPITVIV